MHKHIHTHINKNDAHTLERSYMIALIPLNIFIINHGKTLNSIKYYYKIIPQIYSTYFTLHSSPMVDLGLISTPIQK